MRYEQGYDEEIQHLRNKIPEPSRYDGYRYLVLLPRKGREFLSDNEIIASINELANRKIVFEKILAKTGEGAKFDVWLCLKDNRIYL